MAERTRTRTAAGCVRHLGRRGAGRHGRAEPAAYEARGLLEPDRTDGGTRRYSADDLDRLRRIGDLLDAGLNLAGIAMVLDLETQNSELRAEKERQRHQG